MHLYLTGIFFGRATPSKLSHLRNGFNTHSKSPEWATDRPALRVLVAELEPVVVEPALAYGHHVSPVLLYQSPQRVQVGLGVAGVVERAAPGRVHADRGEQPILCRAQTGGWRW